MVSAIFQAIGDIITEFVTVLGSLFSGVAGLIYTPGSGSDPGQLTVLGTLMLIALSTGLVLWGFYFIRSLIRVRRG